MKPKSIKSGQRVKAVCRFGNGHREIHLGDLGTYYGGDSDWAFVVWDAGFASESEWPSYAPQNIPKKGHYWTKWEYIEKVEEPSEAHMDDYKRMKVRFPCFCARCKTGISAGEVAYGKRGPSGWEMRCHDCHRSGEHATAAAASTLPPEVVESLGRMLAEGPENYTEEDVNNALKAALGSTVVTMGENGVEHIRPKAPPKPKPVNLLDALKSNAAWGC